MRMVMVSVVALLGCNKVTSAVANGDYLHGVATGRLESTGETGAWVIERGHCYSGDLHNYFGAAIEHADGDGVHVSVINDPLKGWALKVNEADTCKQGSNKPCTAHLYEGNACQKLDVNLTTRLGKRMKFFSGTMDVDCKDDSSHVFGKLTLDTCRN